MRYIAIVVMTGCTSILMILGSEVMAEGGEQSPGSSNTTQRSPFSYPPTLVGPMYAKDNGFTVALVDERSPDSTLYKVTAFDLAKEDTTIVSDWSSSRCRRFEGLTHNSWHRFEAVAMNPSGHRTRTVEYWMYLSGDDIWETTPADDPWLADRISEVVGIYNLTDDARDMIKNLPIKIHRNEPGYAAYWGLNRGVGLGLATQPWTFAHETMHAFWHHWDGFPLPCDQMNLLTFRRDLLRFVLAFTTYESLTDEPNPLEEYRPYFNWLAQDFPYYVGPDGQSALNLLLQTYWFDGYFEHDIWTLMFHIGDTDPPMTVFGRPYLLPPTIARYFEGFIEPIQEDEPTTWNKYIDHFRALSQVDRRLMFEASRLHGRLLSGYIAPPPETETSIPEPLRSRVRNADRQGLMDFVNTLEDMACNADCEAWWDADPRFWYHYSINNLIRIVLYLDEIDRSTGIELDKSNWDSMREALGALPSCGDATIGEVRNRIVSLDGITETQRTALLTVLSAREEAYWFCDVWIGARLMDPDPGQSGFGYLLEVQKQTPLSHSRNCSRLSTTPPPADFSESPCW